MATQVITKDDALTADDVAAEAAAEQAAAEAAFASVDEPTATPEPRPEPKPEPKPEKTEAERQAEARIAEEAAAKAAAEAEWAGVPVGLRKTVENITARLGTLDKIEHRVKTVEGRTGAALEGVHALRTAMETAKAVTKAGGDAPTQEQIAAAAASDEEWKRLKEDYPDWAEPTQKLIDRRIDERLKGLAIPPAVDVSGLKTELSGSVSELVAKATSEAKAEARELAKIDREFEDWENMVRTPEFRAWHAAQAPEMQALSGSDKAVDSIKMLRAYTNHSKAVAEATAKAERSKKRLESAITPKGVATPATRTLSEREAMEQGFASVDT